MAESYSDIALLPDFKFDDSSAKVLLDMIAHGCHPLSQPIPFSYSVVRSDFCLFIPTWLAMAKGPLIHFELRQSPSHKLWHWALHFEHRETLQHLQNETYLETLHKIEHQLIAQALNEHLVRHLPLNIHSPIYTWSEWSKKATGSLIFKQPLNSFSEALAALDKFYVVVTRCITTGQTDPILEKLVQTLKHAHQSPTPPSTRTRHLSTAC